MQEMKLIRCFSMFKGNLCPKKELRSTPNEKHVSKWVVQVSRMERSTVFPPKNTDFNWVRPPHSVSNLRMIIYNEPQNESKVERDFRLKRIQLQEWNQQFWEKHNSNFYKCREEFIEAKKKEIYGITEKKNNKPLNSDEMSKFYKKFLDEKYETHLKYNKQWYKKNIGLLFPAIKVFFYQIWKRKLQF